MTRNEMYQLVLTAKDLMRHIESNGGIDEEFVETLNDEIYKIRCISIKKATAIATVISCGCFHESLIDGYRFDLPSTKECMDAFHAVKKMMNKGRKLPIFVYHEEVC